jgi:LemA protein
VIALIIVLILIVVAVIVAIVAFNGLVRLRNRVDAAWAQIDVQLKRRYDLIPNLVETVKGYAAHERQTLEAVIQARNMAVNAQGPAQQAQAENMISGALKSLFALSEAYPDLKANQNFAQLQEELTGTEGRIAYARQFYNDTVQHYNTKIQTFPSAVIAGAMNFSPREYFEVDEQSREPVRVSFDTTQPAADQPAAAQPPETGTPPQTGGQPPAAGQAPQ